MLIGGVILGILLTDPFLISRYPCMPTILTLTVLTNYIVVVIRFVWWVRTINNKLVLIALWTLH